MTILAYLPTILVILACAVSGNGYAQKSFPVFDATLYRDKPDLTTYGVQELKIMYTANLWPNNRDEKAMAALPPKDHVISRVKALALGQKVLCIDIEHWPVRGQDHLIQESVEKYETVLAWVRSAVPNAQLGFYGLPPIRDYWRALTGEKSPRYRTWQQENDKLLPLGGQVDVLFPSLYTFHDDKAAWTRYALAQISEARRFHKPVYVFLWPQFHESNRTLAGKYLPPEFWRHQLELARTSADGIVIWGGWTGSAPARWDEGAAWWQETKKFLSLARSPGGQ